MNNLTNLQNEAQKLRLSPQEKALMRAQIFGEPASVPSYAVSHYRFFSVRFAPVLAAFLIVMLGGGTTYAAQGAVPGDILYTVKVGVNEPVRQALAVSTEAKAAFHADVAETRLEEAEVLASEGRLSASTSAEIEASFETHIARAEEVAKKLEEEEKTDIAVEVEAELDSVLSAHSAILAKLGEESEDEETQEHSRSLADRVTSRVFARLDSSAGATMALKMAAPAMEEMSLVAEDASTASDTALMTTNTTTSDTQEVETDEQDTEAHERAAEILKERAEDALQDARETFEDLQPMLGATTTARVETQFKALDSQFKDGEALYEGKEYMAARSTFSALLRDVVELHAYLRAEKRFNKQFLRSWIDNRFGGWDDAEFEQEAEVRGAHTDDGEDDNDDDNKENGNNRKDDKDEEDDAESRIEVDVNLGL